MRWICSSASLTIMAACVGCAHGRDAKASRIRHWQVCFHMGIVSFSFVMVSVKWFVISPACLCLSEVSFSPAVATACCGASATQVSVFFFRRADTIHEEEGVRYVLVGGEAADGYHHVRTWFPSTLTISKGYEKITFILGGISEAEGIFLHTKRSRLPTSRRDLFKTDIFSRNTR